MATILFLCLPRTSCDFVGAYNSVEYKKKYNG